MSSTKKTDPAVWLWALVAVMAFVGAGGALFVAEAPGAAGISFLIGMGCFALIDLRHIRNRLDGIQRELHGTAPEIPLEVGGASMREQLGIPKGAPLPRQPPIPLTVPVSDDAAQRSGPNLRGPKNEPPKTKGKTG